MKKKKLLIVGMPNSIHTIRWLRQIADQNWDIRVFPCQYGVSIHRELEGVTVYNYLYSDNSGKRVKRRGLFLYSIYLLKILLFFVHKINPDYYQHYLRKVLKEFEPDIVHSLETQHAGYLLLDSNVMGKGENTPTWIHTNWGSDIYLFGKFKEHETKIRKLMSLCNYYTCECNRDLALAKHYGYSGVTFPVYPNAGGFDLDYICSLRSENMPSKRKIIMLKGYQGWAGRALVALRALSRSKELLSGYKVVVFSNYSGEDVKISAGLLSLEADIPVEILRDMPHRMMLNYYGKARIYIGLSISDGISTSLLEAMAMGAFPIQSWTSAADEWIVDKETGFLVPPEDPEVVEKAIRQALLDDDLVDRASEKNWEVIKERMDYEMLKRQTIEMYEYVFNHRGKVQ